MYNEARSVQLFTAFNLYYLTADVCIFITSSCFRFHRWPTGDLIEWNCWPNALNIFLQSNSLGLLHLPGPIFNMKTIYHVYGFPVRPSYFLIGICMPLRHLYNNETAPMMTSSNGNIFRVTGPLCGEFTVTGEFPAHGPAALSFDFSFDLRLNKRLS